jgi:hypothetical protein
MAHLRGYARNQRGKKLSQYTLSGPEELHVDGKVSRRSKLFTAEFATGDQEKFSDIFDMRLLSKAVFEVLNLGEANELKYTFYGAIDPTVKWEPLPNAQNQVLAAQKSKSWTLSNAYAFVRIGVVNSVAGQSTVAQVLAEGKSH